jgi:phosphohistidine phosphatase
MKTLLFFRHGKSDWDAPFDRDHDRPLAKRGRNSAKTMGRFLASAGQEPDVIVTSTAVRARDTVRLASRAGGWSAPIRETVDLYGASPQGVVSLVHAESDSASILLLAGHEPTWSHTVSMLIGGGHLRFPTAGMARIDFDVHSWEGVEFGRGELIWMIPPKALIDGVDANV